jgi:hypothetical protein
VTLQLSLGIASDYPSSSPDILSIIFSDKPHDVDSASTRTGNAKDAKGPGTSKHATEEFQLKLDHGWLQNGLRNFLGDHVRSLSSLSLSLSAPHYFSARPGKD